MRDIYYPDYVGSGSFGSNLSSYIALCEDKLLESVLSKTCHYFGLPEDLSDFDDVFRYLRREKLFGEFKEKYKSFFMAEINRNPLFMALSNTPRIKDSKNSGIENKVTYH